MLDLEQSEYVTKFDLRNLYSHSFQNTIRKVADVDHLYQNPIFRVFAPENFIEFPVCFLEEITCLIFCERKECKLLTDGGLLADEVGFGKTAQMIALTILNPAPSSVHRHKPSRQGLSLKQRVLKDVRPRTAMREENGVSRKVILSIESDATLIICPEYLFDHWEEEIKRLCSCTKPGDILI